MEIQSLQKKNQSTIENLKSDHKKELMNLEDKLNFEKE